MTSDAANKAEKSTYFPRIILIGVALLVVALAWVGFFAHTPELPKKLEPTVGAAQCNYELIRAFSAWVKAENAKGQGTPLVYTLGAGSLLGAMRSQPPGLLQWEHDVDIYAPAAEACCVVRCDALFARFFDTAASSTGERDRQSSGVAVRGERLLTVDQPLVQYIVVARPRRARRRHPVLRLWVQSLSPHQDRVRAGRLGPRVEWGAVPPRQRAVLAAVEPGPCAGVERGGVVGVGPALLGHPRGEHDPTHPHPAHPHCLP